MVAWVLKYRISHWLGKLLVVFSLISPWGAQAAMESVAPSSGGTLWYFSGTGAGGLPSAAAVCQQSQWALSHVTSYSFAGTVPNAAYAFLGYLDCVFTYIPTGQTSLSGTAIPVSNAVCPAPTVNPTVPYRYNPVSGMCERKVPCLAPLYYPDTINSDGIDTIKTVL